MTQLLNTLPSPIFYKDKQGRFLGFNKAYETTFGVESSELIGKSVLDLSYLSIEDRETYHKEDMHLIHTLTSLQREQDMIFQDGQQHNTLYSVNAFANSDGSPGGLIGIFTDITPQKVMEAYLRDVHKQIRESIEYGSLIQHTLLPDHDLFHDYFTEHFVYWQPKDTVGGDIYFFDPLRHDDECFLMMIDCTGHGVPGAFVTMLVKAIERHLVARLMNSDELVSPAALLSIFNRSMKHLLKQDDLKTTANAGFDGCIVYLNKRDGKIVFSGAETSLFYRTHTQALTEIKGNRHSIGYRQSDSDYLFTDHSLTIEPGLQIYLTTDGYLDQNGGEKGFPLGKKRFTKLVENCQSLPLNEQKAYFVEQLALYQGNNDRNDDVTLLSFRF
jgi:PAS domain S-box-containing protein